MTIALIDGDMVAYMAAILAQTEGFPPLPGQTQEDCKPIASLKKAKRIVREILAKWEHHAGCTSSRVYLSDRSGPRTSFRYQIHPEYKNQRTGEKPLLLKECEKYLIDKFGATSRPQLEGDDMLGIAQTTNLAEDTVVVSKDKDMATIPGKTLIVPHLKTLDGVEVETISPKKAAMRHLMQTMIGDTIDNYKGIPGIGPVKARCILLNAVAQGDKPWEAVLRAFKRVDKSKCVHDNGWDEFIMNARCAYILQADDIGQNPINGQLSIRLWAPPGMDTEWLDIGAARNGSTD